jgi:acetyltransferase-like isoleucine patch superfamily enzyme
MSIPITQMLTVGLLPSPLKVAFYRLKGARIGKRVKIGLFSIIRAKSIEIGDDASIGPLSFVTLKESFSLGKRAQIKSMVAIDTGSMSVGEDSVIMEQVIIGGMLTPRSRLDIGKRVKVFPHAFLNPTQEILIEDDVGVGGGSYIFTHGSWQNVLDGFTASFGPVTIKRNAWLPWRVFVTSGVTIGEDAIIGPHSVIRESIPDGGVASGVPAKPIDMQRRHIRKLTPRHKFKLLGDIITEFAEYETWLGRPARVTSADQHKIVMSHPGGNVVLLTQADAAQTDCAVQVSLEGIAPDIRLALGRAGVAWLDISAKEALLSRTGLPLEFRTYLSRYGIRFDLIE